MNHTNTQLLLYTHAQVQANIQNNNINNFEQKKIKILEVAKATDSVPTQYKSVDSCKFLGSVYNFHKKKQDKQ